MNANKHDEIKSTLWGIANLLRGPYRPPQYRLVMLPLVVLRRFDCVLEPTKDKVLAKHKKLIAADTPEEAIERLLTKIADPNRDQPLCNISEYTFQKLLEDQDNIASNLIDYINGFSRNVRGIFEKFNFNEQIEKLDAGNRLYEIIKKIANVDLHPENVTNVDMGGIFEYLVMRFNEQANEEAGDHFTPREVIQLMVELIYTGEKDIGKKGIHRKIYDPACGTGGMLSVSEEYVTGKNPTATVGLYGQEYNDESWAICCSDMLIKNEPVDRIRLADTLTDPEVNDDTGNGKFHYMFANPPYGVEWKSQKSAVEQEYRTLGFSGRFGAGLPPVGDGSLLFLQHMISKFMPLSEGGSKIAIVFNGSPLFSGDAGSGPSDIRRWIIENDWLDAVVALPNDIFYNTGISTYIWLVTNRKPDARRGKVQLINGAEFFEKMKKSLGKKRNKIGYDQIEAITSFYANFKDGEKAAPREGEEKKIVSKFFPNSAFGYLKITVDRPLRMNFQAGPERIARLDAQTAFINLAVSKKLKDEEAIKAEEEAGRKHQAEIKAVLQSMDAGKLYKDRAAFDADLTAAAKAGNVKISDVKKAVFAALGERDQSAEPCVDSKGEIEPDPDLRDTENIPLPKGANPPPLNECQGDALRDALNEMFKDDIDAYMTAEVLPNVPDVWVDWDKTKIGYEIPLNRCFYVYKPPRQLEEIEINIRKLEGEIADLLKESAV